MKGFKNKTKPLKKSFYAFDLRPEKKKVTKDKSTGGRRMLGATPVTSTLDENHEAEESQPEAPVLPSIQPHSTLTADDADLKLSFRDRTALGGHPYPGLPGELPGSPKDSREQLPTASAQEPEGLELDFRQERELYKARLEEMNEQNEALRKQLIHVATKAAKLPNQPLSHRSTNEILSLWQAFTYQVRNLVMGHFKFKSNQGKMKDWARSQRYHLEEVTPFYNTAVTKAHCVSSLVEAVVWNALHRLIFGNSGGDGPMCWAGAYAAPLSKLSERFYKDLDLDRSANHLAIYHRWKSLTTDLIFLTDSRRDSLHNTGNKAVIELDCILGPIQDQKSSEEFGRSLQRIVDKAIDLDQLFCGQEAWYCIAWPNAGRHDFPIDEETMKIVGGGSDSKKVRFVVRPALCRVGGTSYREKCVLDNFTVCMH